MQTKERAYVVDNLDASEKRLLDLTEGLTPEQWQFKPDGGRWSIAENIEHCILVEKAIAAGIQEALAGPPDKEKGAAVVGKDVYVTGVGTATGRKLEAQEAFQPTGRWSFTDRMLAELRSVRAKNKVWAKGTEAELREHCFPHQALGDLDCYQWMVVMALHGERHAKQIEEVKADAGYPA